MTTFLFWNLQNKEDVESVVARTARLHEVDVLILAEVRIKVDVMLRELNAASSDYHFPKNPNDAFMIFTKFPGDFLEPFRDHGRLTVRKLNLPEKTRILFAAIHFFDRRNYNQADQHSLSREVADFLREAEEHAGHERTVLVGDFNMNPFDHGMVDPKGFGALMTRALALKRSAGKEGPRGLFYNPMWGRFGEETAGPPGTYYFSERSPTNIYWHTLDQVLIRPGLLGAFRDEDLGVLSRVPTADGDLDLIAERPKHRKLRVSDHLPIRFGLNLTTGPHDA